MSSTPFGRLRPLMQSYAILTNRKRATIALVHSVFFLVLATVTSLRMVEPLTAHRRMTSEGIALLAMYAVVFAVLGILSYIATCARERMYFALCASSAGTALMRTVVGDHAMHGAQYLRVLMLVCAVIVGSAILKGHSESVTPVLAPD